MYVYTNGTAARIIGRRGENIRVVEELLDVRTKISGHWMNIEGARAEEAARAVTGVQRFNGRVTPEIVHDLVFAAAGYPTQNLRIAAALINPVKKHDDK